VPEVRVAVQTLLSIDVKADELLWRIVTPGQTLVERKKADARKERTAPDWFSCRRRALRGSVP
jgi:hypothetical protein